MRSALLRARTWLSAHDWSVPVTLAYLALVGVFFAALVQFYIPGKGLSVLIAFGANQEKGQLSKVRALDRYVVKNSDGYDAQYYVQIAMDPSLHNQALKRAVDSLPYRARRILFSATAYVFGLGQPAWILQVFAGQNVVSWFLLAALLLHWFPPCSWENFFRWTGVMFSMGICASFRNALFDGPSLLLIAGGVFLLEKGRPWSSTMVLALGGLGKETNLLGSAALLPPFAAGRRDWSLAILRGLLTAAPLALWIGYITLVVGRGATIGERNFDLPFVAYGHKWQEMAEKWPEFSMANTGPLWSLLMLVALTVQFLYLVLRPQWEKAWWRIGISYALLMVFLGDAVWEGYPGAASRVLLPMQLAFNVLVPFVRGWWLVLVLGNLALLAAPVVLQAPSGEGYQLKGSRELLTNSAGRSVAVEFGQGWYSTENGDGNTWAWTSGSAELQVLNPHDTPLEFRLRFGLGSTRARIVRVMLNGSEIWHTVVSEHSTVAASFFELPLRVGSNRIEFLSDEPAVKIGFDSRLLAFSVQNLRIDLLRRLPPVAAPR